MKISPRPKKRTLRKFSRVARKDHGKCRTCRKEIVSGDEYECEIEVVTCEGEKYFNVHKFHVFCPFNPLDDPPKERASQTIPRSRAA